MQTIGRERERRSTTQQTRQTNARYQTESRKTKKYRPQGAVSLKLSENQRMAFIQRKYSHDGLPVHEYRQLFEQEDHPHHDFPHGSLKDQYHA